MKKNKYGEYNDLRKAYFPRTNEEKKQNRNIGRMDKLTQKKILEDLLKENRQALCI